MSNRNFLPAPKECGEQIDPSITYCIADNIEGGFNDPSYVSVNQKLVGKSNPQIEKLRIWGKSGRVEGPPGPLGPPLAAQEYWKPNNFVVPNIINTSTNQDLTGSGYVVSTCCCKDLPKSKDPNLCLCNLPSSKTVENTEITSQIIRPTMNPPSSTPSSSGQIIEPFQYTNKTNGECTKYCTEKSDCSCNNCKNKQEYVVGPNYPGAILTTGGYSSEQLLDHNIPSNLPVGAAQLSSDFDSYNQNLFTQNIQPGVNARYDVIEPINSNMGISFDQQFEPVTLEKDCNGDFTYVSHDPKLKPIKELPPDNQFEDLTSTSDIYDPRLTGYGTSYRSYYEPITGQTRFFYDDIDAHRQYNYIVRSKIDTMDGADSTGPMSNVQEKNNCHIRTMAHDNFFGRYYTIPNRFATKTNETCQC